MIPPMKKIVLLIPNVSSFSPFLFFLFGSDAAAAAAAAVAAAASANTQPKIPGQRKKRVPYSRFQIKVSLRPSKFVRRAAVVGGGKGRC